VSTTLRFAGRAIEDAEDHIRRYCGLAWSRGTPETWAYPYYDLPPADPDPAHVNSSDVLRAAALHAGLSRANLAFFIENAAQLDSVLSGLPRSVDLSDADDSTISQIVALADLAEPGRAELSLITKVLHTKRRRLIPLLDRSLLDWYHPTISQRGAGAWAELVRAVHTDLSAPSNQTALDEIRLRLERDLASELIPSALRLADIAVWMETTQR
jgi:hypothetical protein